MTQMSIHLNNVLTLPSENETSHFHTFIMHSLNITSCIKLNHRTDGIIHLIEVWWVRWPHVWRNGLSFSNVCMKPESMTVATAWVARLGAVADWWRSWPMANVLVCLCSCRWRIFWTYFVTINLFSLYTMNFVSRHAWCSVWYSKNAL